MGQNKDRSISLRVCDPEKGKEIARYSVGQKKFASGITVSPDRKLVACTYDQKELFVFDVVSGKTIASIHQPGGVRNPCFTPDGKGILIDSEGHRLWDFKAGKYVCCFRLWSNNTRLMFSPDGKTLAAGFVDGSVLLYNAATGARMHHLFRSSSKPEIPWLAFSPDGRYLASDAYEDFPKRKPFTFLGDRLILSVWEVHTGELVRELKQAFPPPNEPDAASKDFKQKNRFMRNYRRNCRGLAFSPDGRILVSCSLYHTQRWEVASGQLRDELDEVMYNLHFSRDGRLLAAGKVAFRSGNRHDEVCVWDWLDPCLKLPKPLGLREIDDLWTKLASPDAAIGYQAILTLRADPEPALAALRERLRRVEPLAPGELDRLIANLDEDDFAARERASQRLAVLGAAARPVLLRVKGQRPSLELRRRMEDLLPRLTPAGSPDRLRCLRAVEVLERIGTEDARRILTQLASGAAGSAETEDAKAALLRLRQK